MSAIYTFFIYIFIAWQHASKISALRRLEHSFRNVTLKILFGDVVWCCGRKLWRAGGGGGGGGRGGLDFWEHPYRYTHINVMRVIISPYTKWVHAQLHSRWHCFNLSRFDAQHGGLQRTQKLKSPPLIRRCGAIKASLFDAWSWPEYSLCFACCREFCCHIIPKTLRT